MIAVDGRHFGAVLPDTLTISHVPYRTRFDDSSQFH